MNDFSIDIAIASKRYAKTWRNKRWQWSQLVDRCSKTQRTDETVAEYAHMSRDEQSGIKDVGGFVGGYLNDGVRKNENVRFRSMATLDIDYGTPDVDVWEEFTMLYNCAALMYSTHKHTKEKPRLRLVIPFSRQVTAQEYEPICRRIAEQIGIELFDITTYQLPRLFYWPSTSKDGDFVFRHQDGQPLDPDEVLTTYVDWQDVTSWPVASREGELIKHEIKKAGEPTEKNGLIGAFCRAYSIEDAIEKFLSDVYEPTAMPDRYTYKMGSVAGGLVCYDGKFAYSHHDTDPASRHLCNAFDLVRLHKFGIRDEGARTTDVTRLPSYIEMTEFAAADDEVKLLLDKERRAQARVDFLGIDEEEDESADEEAWVKELDSDKKGNIKPTTKNLVTILEKDKYFAGKLWHNLFSDFDCVTGGLPWDKRAEQWQNKDDANLRAYVEGRYGVSSKDKLRDATVVVFTKHRKHPVRDYLKALKWDGVPRLDKLIIDYVGAEDNELTRLMTRKHFTAAVARVMNPGCKYDYCLIMTGPEGIGKSTLLNIMGGEYFSDSVVTMEGKQAMEQLRNVWIAELPELTSVKRSDVETVKAFITRRDDRYRAAYAQLTESHLRQCVFCGTTNETFFLKGDTGNRRFWVIKVDGTLRKKGLTELQNDRDQLWAEAVQRWRDGEKLYLDSENEAKARARQQEYNDDSDDPLRELVLNFVKMKLPADWSTWDLMRRRAFINNPDPLDAEGVVLRDRVCVPEVVCECLGRGMADKEYKYMARKVGKILGENYEFMGTSRHAEKLYGRQRAWLVENDEYIDESDL